MKKLRPYQREAVRIQASQLSALNASSMGTGKTLMAVERVRYMQGIKSVPRVLVVAPLNTHYGWLNAFLEQYPYFDQNRHLVTICGTPRTDPENWARMTSKAPGVYIIGWEAMRGSVSEEIGKDADGDDVRVTKEKIPPWGKTGVWDLVIADECHRLQNYKSLTLKVMRRIKSVHRLALSGTPAGNKPQGMWGTLNWLWPDRYSSFWRWVNQYLTYEQKHYYNRAVKEITGEKRPGAIFEDIPCVVRYRWEDVADQVPEVITHNVRVDMTQTQREIYESFEKEAFAWLEEYPVATPLPLVQRLRLRQTALAEPTAVEKEDGELSIVFDENTKAPKIDALKEILDDVPTDEPVLVFTHSKRFAQVVHKRLGRKYRSALWTGDVSPAKRREIMKKFGVAHGPRVLVAVISAIGEGTDGLQGVCSHEIWLSQDDNNLLNQQAEARLNRSGQKRPVNRWYIYSADTIDVRVYERLQVNRADMSRFYKDVV